MVHLGKSNIQVSRLGKSSLSNVPSNQLGACRKETKDGGKVNSVSPGGGVSASSCLGHQSAWSLGLGRCDLYQQYCPLLSDFWSWTNYPRPQASRQRLNCWASLFLQPVDSIWWELSGSVTVQANSCSKSVQVYLSRRLNQNIQWMLKLITVRDILPLTSFKYSLFKHLSLPFLALSIAVLEVIFCGCLQSMVKNTANTTVFSIQWKRNS